MLHYQLKNLRILNGYSQSELASRLHISRGAYAMYESGKRQPSYDVLLLLADYYQVSLDYLFGRTDIPAIPASMERREEEFIRKYQSIDKRGRETVDELLQYEYHRSRSLRRL